MSLTPLWFDTTKRTEYPTLRKRTEASVAVIGAGIAGLTAALHLQRAGKDVVVLEARRIGDGETGHTTSHLTELLDMRYFELESKFGREGAVTAAEASRAAITRIETLCGEAENRCGFQRVPAYLYAETEEQKQELQKELAALARVGSYASWLDTLPLMIPVLGAVRVENQAQFHPLEYLTHLAKQFVRAGGRIFENSEVLSVDDGEPCRVVLTDERTVTAKDVLVLANVPVTNRVTLHTTNAAYRSYAIAARVNREFPEGLFWDMEDPYHYTRLQQTERGTFLIVGGEDHKTGQREDTAAAFAALEEFTATKFGLRNVEYRWSGQIIEPVDGLPFIGRNPGEQHVYVATGFSGTGITFGTVAGMLLTDLVRGVANRLEELFSPSRVKPLAQAKEFIAENVDFPATLARDRVSPGDVERVEDVPLGEGRLVRQSGKMLAVYRRETGEVSACSAVCTHLGCYVRWNNAERSWDCPCHGSRFKPDGAVVNGPATRALEATPLSSSDEEHHPALKGIS